MKFLLSNYIRLDKYRARVLYMSRRIYERKQGNESAREKRVGGDATASVGGSHAVAVDQPDGRRGVVRVLLRRGAGDQPAEDLAAPGVSAAGGRGAGAARRIMDALPGGGSDRKSTR